ncbi:MAG TPA: isochorismatase family protein [Gaiellaceae bacterium]
MQRALVIVDIQKDYFPGGAHPLEAPEHAAAAAKQLLDSFRAAGDPVIHVRHEWDEDGATFMRPGTEGVEIHPDVAPVDSGLVITKAYPIASVRRRSSPSFARLAWTSSSSAG